MSTLMLITEADRQAQRTIEADVERYLQVVAGLRRRLNSFALINRLPIEILTEIFLLCQDDSWRFNVTRSRSAEYEAIPSPLRWTLITTVCHHWHQLVAQTPRLWSRIDLRYPKFAKRSLQLAKQSLLRVETARLDVTERSLFDDIVSNDLHRVSSIQWSLLPHVYSEVALSATSSTVFSQLRNIRITVAGTASRLPQIFANVEFPSIQTLELVNCIANLPPCFLSPTLKTLSLNGCRGSQSLALVEFAQCLSQMTQLTSLELKEINFGTAQQAALPRISLPHLRRAVVKPPSNTHHNYIPLLQKLDLPSTAHLDLDFQHINNLPQETLSSLLQVFLDHVRPLNCGTMVFRNVYSGSTVVGLWEEALDPIIFSTQTPVAPYRLSLHPSSQHEKAFWDGLTHVLELSSVETLHCQNLHQWFAVNQQWKYLLHPCSDLKALSLEGNGAEALALLLQPDEGHRLNATKGRDNDGHSASSPLIAPKLEAIHFYRVAWPRNDYMVDEKPFDELLSVIAHRKEVGYPIQDVFLRKCWNIDDDIIETLEEDEVMDEVEVSWDGFVEFDEDDDDEDEFQDNLNLDYDYDDFYDPYDNLGLYGYW